MQVLGWRFTQLMKFYASAETLATVHSPLAYRVLDHMLDPVITVDLVKDIEQKRTELKENHTEIDRVDFGAGSTTIPNKQQISAIAKKSLSDRKQCRELSKMVNLLNPNNVIELGTSLGIMTAYLASANHSINVTSFEGDPSVLQIAESILLDLKIKNVKLISGKFDDTLPAYLETKEEIGFAFLDGHHTYEATIRYFNYLKPFITSTTVMVIDDIYWSPGMNKAWNSLLESDKVRLAIDRFDYGILFFDPAIKQKTSLKVIDQAYKPWRRVI